MVGRFEIKLDFNLGQKRKINIGEECRESTETLHTFGEGRSEIVPFLTGM
jgi:hypothetical protein